MSRVLTYLGLESHLSSDTQQSTNYTANTSLSTAPFTDTYGTGVGESQQGSDKVHAQNPELRSILPPTTAWRTLFPWGKA